MSDTNLVMNDPCNICNSVTTEHARVLIRQKYEARMLRCSNCGFIFIENPTWLAEAYAEPINRQDTGYVMRNLLARDSMRMAIESNLNPLGKFLDYAAGYGLFVRLMRDIGYDFRWSDLYCQNLFCRGFEVPEPLVGPFEAVTAFEVFEHLTKPMEEMKKLMAITSCLVFSTNIIPEPVPQPNDWWYYGLEHGQHIAFYSKKSLELLADRFGCYFLTDKTHPNLDFHVFSRKKLPANFFPVSRESIPFRRVWARLRAKPLIKRAQLPG
jgi:hypothetical protein